jgi:hypothetical protein
VLHVPFFCNLCCAHFYIAISSITCLAVVLECGLIGLWCAVGMLFECRGRVQHRWGFQIFFPWCVTTAWSLHGHSTYDKIRPFCQAAPVIFTFASYWHYSIYHYMFSLSLSILFPCWTKSRLRGIVQDCFSPLVMDVLMLASLSDCNHQDTLQMTVKHLTASLDLSFPHCFMANLSVNRWRNGLIWQLYECIWLYNQAVRYWQLGCYLPCALVIQGVSETVIARYLQVY